MQVEIGTRYFDGEFIVFTEKETATVTTFHPIAFAPINDWMLLRVRGDPGPGSSEDYILEYNNLDSIGWHNADKFNVGWASGWAMGETEKKGTDTTMNSKHRNLKYLYNNNGGETDWAAMVCAVDEAPGWHWSPLSGSNNDYDVVPGSTGAC